MTETGLVMEMHKARRRWRAKHYGDFDRFDMSTATLKALAAECGLEVEDPDALRGADGKLLNPSPPMIFGRPIHVDDSIPFRDFHLIELFPAMARAGSDD